MPQGPQALILQIGEDRAGHHRLIGPACVRERVAHHRERSLRGTQIIITGAITATRLRLTYRDLIP
jgi:hypothetical protein